MSEADKRWMQAALALARRGLGQTGENPSVGCVLVSNGKLIGRGRTAQGGRPHAETIALKQALQRYGEAALKDATAYVTLEPCAHHGKTPPCAEALIAAGISKVVAPISDPDPRVSGKGFEKLRAAGIEVVTGIEEKKAREILSPFLFRTERKRPFVTLKLACSLDGRIATKSGESQWITGPAARRYAHLLRAQSDAILVGSGTVLADDPLLDVRLSGLEQASPIKVIADRRLQTPPGARLLNQDRTPVWILCSESNQSAANDFRTSGTTLIDLPSDATVSEQLNQLALRGIGSVFCEGGANLAAGLLKEGCVDRLIVIYAGLVIGQEGLSNVGPLGLSQLSDANLFELDKSFTLGSDVVTEWKAQ